MRGRKQDELAPSDRLVMRSKASHTQVTAARCTRTCETNQSECLAFPFFSKIQKNLTFPIRRSSVLLRRLICPSLCRSSLGASAARCLHGTQQSDNSAFQQHGNTYVCERRSVPNIHVRMFLIHSSIPNFSSFFSTYIKLFIP